MSEFVYTDLDGNTLEAAESAHPRFAAVITCTDPEADAGFASVGLTADGARDLAAKLTEWAGEEEPPAPEYQNDYEVGARVDVVGYSDFWDGPATVTESRKGTPWISVHRDGMPDDWIGAFHPEHLRPRQEPTPDYAALAAEFKPGDLAIVGDNPGTHANGSGYVSARFAGKAVNIVAKEEDMWEAFGPCTAEGPWAEAVHVALGNGDTNYIHVAHLTKAKAVPA